MARLSQANSTAVIDVPDELVEKFTAAGWVEAKPAKAEPKRRASKETETE